FNFRILVEKEGPQWKTLAHSRRRDFLKDAGALSMASLALWAGGIESCLQQIQNRPTRKNIQTLWNANPSDLVITTCKNAVTAMKALPAIREAGRVKRRSISTSASIATGSGCPGIAFIWFISS